MLDSFPPQDWSLYAALHQGRAARTDVMYGAWTEEGKNASLDRLLPESIPRRQVLTALSRGCAESPDQQVKMIGTLNMIRAATPDGIQILRSNATQIAQTPLERAHRAAPGIADAAIRKTYKLQLAEAVSGIRESSGETINVLSQLASDSGQYIELRRAASRALRNIHTAPAVAALAPLMSDPDTLISTYAMSGLACYANAVPLLDDTVPDHNMNLNKQGPFKTSETLAHMVAGPVNAGFIE